MMHVMGKIKPLKMKIIIFKDTANEWRFRIVARNGKTIAASEGYERQAGAMKTAKKFSLPITIK